MLRVWEENGIRETGNGVDRVENLSLRVKVTTPRKVPPTGHRISRGYSIMPGLGVCGARLGARGFGLR